MTIHEGILQRFAKEHVIVMKGDQSLGDALDRLAESGYTQEQSYLVVEAVKPAGEPYQTSDPYLVSRFTALHELLQTPDSLTKTLATCPFPAAMRVERQDTPESAKSIANWVRTTEGATLVVIDDSGFVALLASSAMPLGGSRQGSLPTKAGLGSGKEDCPRCHDNRGKGFDFKGNKAECKACGQKFVCV